MKVVYNRIIPFKGFKSINCSDYCLSVRSVLCLM